jgi:hypothetical protein
MAEWKTAKMDQQRYRDIQNLATQLGFPEIDIEVLMLMNKKIMRTLEMNVWSFWVMPLLVTR